MKSASRHYYYPLRNPDNSNDITLVEITEEQYRALYPEIWRIQKRERKLGRCLCPVCKLWKCDGDCLICPFHTAGIIWSLDQELEIMGDHRASNDSDPADVVVEHLLLQKLIQRLGELCPEALKVGDQKLTGLSERGSLEVLGLTRTSFRRHLRAAKEALRVEFGDVF